MANQDDYARITLRLPRPIHEALASASESAFRSMNAEIVARLESSLEIDKALGEIAPGAAISEAAPILLDLSSERDAAIDSLNDFNLEVHAKLLMDQLSHNDARLDKIESRVEYLIEQFQKVQKR